MTKLTSKSLLAALATVAFVGTASAQTAPKLPAGCEAVTVFRDGITRPDIALTFRGEGGTVDAIKFCNPAGATNVVGVNPSKTAGARVVLRTAGGKGVIGLPTAYAAGDVHNVWCDVVAGKAVFKLYELPWAGGLKSEMKLVDQTAKIAGEIDKHTKGCIDSFTPDLRAQLKD